LNLQCGEPLSNFAVNFNLRRCSKGQKRKLTGTAVGGGDGNDLPGLAAAVFKWKREPKM
jgi:hypothetical protein